MTAAKYTDGIAFIDNEGRIYVGNKDEKGAPRFVTLADMRAQNLTAVTVKYQAEIKSNFTGAALATATGGPIGRVHVIVEKRGGELTPATPYEIDNLTLAAGPVITTLQDLQRQTRELSKLQKEWGKGAVAGSYTAWEAYCRDNTPGYEKFKAQRQPATPRWAQD